MTEETTRCPVCLSDAEVARHPDGRDVVKVNRRYCGDYEVVGSAIPAFENEEGALGPGPEKGTGDGLFRLEASAWLREHQGIVIGRKDLERFLTLRRRSVLEIADELLVALGKETSFPGEIIDLNQPVWRTRARVRDRTGVIGISELLEELGYVVVGQRTMGEDGYDPVHIAVGGWRRLDELRAVNPDSPQGFVAMSFHDSMTRIYDEVFMPAIETAGYVPHRVDRREFTGRIDDEIVAQIRRSRFVVADFTGHRGGVYWEAGLAEGLGLPVIFTCRKDDMENLHFDVRQNNTIVWKPDRLEQFRSALRTRIEAVLGKGPLPPSEGQ